LETSDTPLGGGIVLIGDGFEEGSAIDCLHALRDAGAETALVGLTAGLVTGSRGIVVQPDLSLDRVVRESVPRLIVIGGGGRCLNVLLVDPRVHRLVRVAARRGGQIAILSSAADEAQRVLRVPLIAKGLLPVREFVARLLRLSA
jgi:4-methyl-5(b-hydroxyethyl)-thiazole monophosphate biosynthesis